MSAFITLARTGDAGCSSSAEKAQAEIMNVPRQMASIMYSGQCAVIARLASSAQHPVLKLAATGSSSSCAAKTFTAMAGVHWVSLLMRGGIRDLGKGFTAEKQNHTLGLCVCGCEVQRIGLSTEREQDAGFGDCVCYCPENR